MLMKRTDKILSCCQWGCNRSVHVKYVLNLHGFENVLTLGLEHTDAHTADMLCKWADVILVPEAYMKEHILFEERAKVIVLPIGPDCWGGWQQKELFFLVEKSIQKLIEE